MIEWPVPGYHGSEPQACAARTGARVGAWALQGLAGRGVDRAENLRVALLALTGVTGPPVPEQVIECLPRVEVHYRRRQGLSGTTKWTGGRWVILVNRNETWGRQRFSLAHEFKHVLDWSKADAMYRHGSRTAEFQSERAADAFAASLLMPKSSSLGSGQLTGPDATAYSALLSSLALVDSRRLVSVRRRLRSG